MRTLTGAWICFLVATVLTGAAPRAQSNAKVLFDSGGPRAVGIHYWLETKNGVRLTERTAASANGRFTLHVRSNTAGFLSVWTTADGRLLTSEYNGYPGHRIEAAVEYVAPGDFRVSASAAEGLVVVLFARSQTEQVRNLGDAWNKLSKLLPSIVRQSDENPGAVGTYVVNRDGNQPGVEIALTR